MKHLLSTTCMGVLMLLSSCTSCKVDTDTTINVKSRKVQKFIELAREGDAEACKSLAICYRNGDGVEKSWINMVYMYEMYCNRSGEDVDNIVELFEEGEPFRLFCEILNIAEYNSEADAKFKQLEQLAPIEAKAITAAMDISAGKEVEQAFETIKEAEAQGSEAAVIFQIIRFEKEENETDYEKYLHKVAVKYPFLYQKLGAMAIRKYHSSQDFSDIRKAMEFYYKADEHGMLSHKYAYALLYIYEYFGKKGMLQSNEEEISRLAKLSKME